MARRHVRLLAAALAVASVVAVLAALRAPAASVERTGPECPTAFPRQVLARVDRAGLVVCSNDAGTATFVLNATAAVWTVTTPSPLALHILPLDPAARSFADLVSAPLTYIPSTAIAVVPARAERVLLAVDARLTLAQLAHDQLVTTLARRGGPAPAALRIEPSAARRALTSCLAAILEHVVAPEDALAQGTSTAVLAEAARALDAGGRSECGKAWMEAKLNSSLPSGDVTPFVSDIVAWEANATFAARAEDASAAYRQVTPGERT